MKTITQFDDYRQYLSEVFAQRQGRNSRYSLRSFARDLDLAPSSLSALLKCRYNLTIKKALLVAKRLGLAGAEKHLFIDLARLKRPLRDDQFKEVLLRIGQLRMEIEAKVLRDEWLVVISDWYHLAIVELVRMGAWDGNEKQVAAKLGIKALQVGPAVQRLRKIGMLTSEGDGLKVATGFATTNQGVPSEVIRGLHRQILLLARKSMESHPINLRDNSFVVFATAKDQVEASRGVLQDFRREFMSRMEQAPDKDAVYCLSVNLFPLDQFDAPAEP